MLKKIAIILIVAALMSCLALPVMADTVSSGVGLFPWATDKTFTKNYVISVFPNQEKVIIGKVCSYDRYYFDGYPNTYACLPVPDYLMKDQYIHLTGEIYVTNDSIKIYNSFTNSEQSVNYVTIGNDENGVTWYKYVLDYSFWSNKTDGGFRLAIHTTGNSLHVSNISLTVDNTYLVVNSINTGVQSILDRSDSNATWIRDEINNNANSLSAQEQQNANQNASNIQANQDANTDKQIEADKQLQENERNEAQTGGNSNVGAVTGALPDKSSGFLSGISTLANSMSYSGTDCVWKLPSIYLPEIPGVMDKITLTDELDVNLTQFVEFIPSAILSVVRALFDIGLVIFCAKELYSLIQQIMTTKGGGAD